MFLEFVLALIIIRYLRTQLRKDGILPAWDRLLTIGIIIAVAFLIFGIVGRGHTGRLAALLTDGLLGYIIYFVFTKKEFIKFKSATYAVMPYIGVSVIKNITALISNDFYEEWSRPFETAELFAVIWLIATWILSRKQRKALELERLKALEKEKQYQLSEAMKASLEVQVAERTAALTQQKEELEHALGDLKATQAQLIQSEKMASLGELTAGIAHEIQNPLNFINNFSEVNTELITELKDAMAKGDMEEAKAIADDITANEQKINHHGKRADAIVKGMLQHSRSSGGQKEPTDINALADEYLRLSYQGMRAKDKSFNATLQTDFNADIGKIDVVPQDIGRVLLNLYNNAFYAVNEKKKTAGETYEPIVSVCTKKVDGKSDGYRVEIRVKDNGNGIPQKVLDKIFQPFFTTKPSGQGTGLGLSLSYDIIKAHGGEIKVETKEGEGSAFFFQLPVKDDPIPAQL